MTPRFRRSRRAAWIALVAVAALALGPTVSRALLSGGVATAAATHAHCEPVEGASDEPVTPHHGSLDRCGLCAVAALPALLPAPTATEAVSAMRFVAVAAPTPTPIAARPIRSATSPRGPPRDA